MHRAAVTAVTAVAVGITIDASIATHSGYCC